MDDPIGVAESVDILKPTGTLASSVYEQLRSDILNGRFEPGSKLRLQFLAKQYSVGSKLLACLQFDPPQSERVADHGDRTQAHRGSCDHRT